MSLTSLLDLKDVRARFRQEFPKPKLIAKHPILAEPLTKRYSTVGTAFDYLLRFYLERVNPDTVVAKGYWVADYAFNIIAGEAETTKDRELAEKAKKIIASARKNHATFLETGVVTDELIVSTLALAQLDPVVRAGSRVYESVFAWIKSGIVDPQDVQDERNLISLVRPEDFKASKICLLDPTFGSASFLVGGADVDLVIDDTIIDIKTVKNLELRGKDFHQIVGYYILYLLSGIDGLPQSNQIKHLSIYFSRYAYFYKVDVEQVINVFTLPQFLNWFVDRAEQEFK